MDNNNPMRPPEQPPLLSLNLLNCCANCGCPFGLSSSSRQNNNNNNNTTTIKYTKVQYPTTRGDLTGGKTISVTDGINLLFGLNRINNDNADFRKSFPKTPALCRPCAVAFIQTLKSLEEFKNLTKAGSFVEQVVVGGSCHNLIDQRNQLVNNGHGNSYQNRNLNQVIKNTDHQPQQSQQQQPHHQPHQQPRQQPQHQSHQQPHHHHDHHSNNRVSVIHQAPPPPTQVQQQTSESRTNNDSNPRHHHHDGGGNESPRRNRLEGHNALTHSNDLLHQINHHLVNPSPLHQHHNLLHRTDLEPRLLNPSQAQAQAQQGQTGANMNHLYNPSVIGQNLQRNGSNYSNSSTINSTLVPNNNNASNGISAIHQQQQIYFHHNKRMMREREHQQGESGESRESREEEQQQQQHEKNITMSMSMRGLNTRLQAPQQPLALPLPLPLRPNTRYPSYLAPSPTTLGPNLPHQDLREIRRFPNHNAFTESQNNNNRNRAGQSKRKQQQEKEKEKKQGNERSNYNNNNEQQQQVQIPIQIPIPIQPPAYHTITDYSRYQQQQHHLGNGINCNRPYLVPRQIPQVINPSQHHHLIIRNPVETYPNPQSSSLRKGSGGEEERITATQAQVANSPLLSQNVIRRVGGRMDLNPSSSNQLLFPHIPIFQNLKTSQEKQHHQQSPSPSTSLLNPCNYEPISDSEESTTNDDDENQQQQPSHHRNKFQYNLQSPHTAHNNNNNHSILRNVGVSTNIDQEEEGEEDLLLDLRINSTSTTSSERIQIQRESSNNNQPQTNLHNPPIQTKKQKVNKPSPLSLFNISNQKTNSTTTITFDHLNRQKTLNSPSSSVLMSDVVTITKVPDDVHNNQAESHLNNINTNNNLEHVLITRSSVIGVGGGGESGSESERNSNRNIRESESDDADADDDEGGIRVVDLRRRKRKNSYSINDDRGNEPTFTVSSCMDNGESAKCNDDDNLTIREITSTSQVINQTIENTNTIHVSEEFGVAYQKKCLNDDDGIKVQRSSLANNDNLSCSILNPTQTVITKTSNSKNVHDKGVINEINEIPLKEPTIQPQLLNEIEVPNQQPLKTTTTNFPTTFTIINDNSTTTTLKPLFTPSKTKFKASSPDPTKEDLSQRVLTGFTKLFGEKVSSQELQLQLQLFQKQRQKNIIIQKQQQINSDKSKDNSTNPIETPLLFEPELSLTTAQQHQQLQTSKFALNLDIQEEFSALEISLKGLEEGNESKINNNDDDEDLEEGESGDIEQISSSGASSQKTKQDELLPIDKANLSLVLGKENWDPNQINDKISSDLSNSNELPSMETMRDTLEVEAAESLCRMSCDTFNSNQMVIQCSDSSFSNDKRCSESNGKFESLRSQVEVPGDDDREEEEDDVEEVISDDDDEPILVVDLASSPEGENAELIVDEDIGEESIPNHNNNNNNDKVNYSDADCDDSDDGSQVSDGASITPDPIIITNFDQQLRPNCGKYSNENEIEEEEVLISASNDKKEESSVSEKEEEEEEKLIEEEENRRESNDSNQSYPPTKLPQQQEMTEIESLNHTSLEPKPITIILDPPIKSPPPIIIPNSETLQNFDHQEAKTVLSEEQIESLTNEEQIESLTNQDLNSEETFTNNNAFQISNRNQVLVSCQEIQGNEMEGEFSNNDEVKAEEESRLRIIKKGIRFESSVVKGISNLDSEKIGRKESSQNVGIGVWNQDLLVKGINSDSEIVRKESSSEIVVIEEEPVIKDFNDSIHAIYEDKDIPKDEDDEDDLTSRDHSIPEPPETLVVGLFESSSIPNPDLNNHHHHPSPELAIASYSAPILECGNAYDIDVSISNSRPPPILYITDPNSGNKEEMIRVYNLEELEIGGEENVNRNSNEIDLNIVHSINDDYFVNDDSILSSNHPILNFDASLADTHMSDMITLDQYDNNNHSSSSPYTVDAEPISDDESKDVNNIPPVPNYMTNSSVAEELVDEMQMGFCGESANNHNLGLYPEVIDQIELEMEAIHSGGVAWEKVLLQGPVDYQEEQQDGAVDQEIADLLGVGGEVELSGGEISSDDHSSHSHGKSESKRKQSRDKQQQHLNVQQQQQHKSKRMKKLKNKTKMKSKSHHSEQKVNSSSSKRKKKRNKKKSNKSMKYFPGKKPLRIIQSEEESGEEEFAMDSSTIDASTKTSSKNAAEIGVMRRDDHDDDEPPPGSNSFSQSNVNPKTNFPTTQSTLQKSSKTPIIRVINQKSQIPLETNAQTIQSDSVNREEESFVTNVNELPVLLSIAAQEQEPYHNSEEEQACELITPDFLEDEEEEEEESPELITPDLVEVEDGEEECQNIVVEITENMCVPEEQDLGKSNIAIGTSNNNDIVVEVEDSGESLLSPRTLLQPERPSEPKSPAPLLAPEPEEESISPNTPLAPIENDFYNDDDNEISEQTAAAASTTQNPSAENDAIVNTRLVTARRIVPLSGCQKFLEDHFSDSSPASNLSSEGSWSIKGETIEKLLGIALKEGSENQVIGENCSIEEDQVKALAEEIRENKENDENCHKESIEFQTQDLDSEKAGGGESHYHEERSIELAQLPLDSLEKEKTCNDNESIHQLQIVSEKSDSSINSAFSPSLSPVVEFPNDHHNHNNNNSNADDSEIQSSGQANHNNPITVNTSSISLDLHDFPSTQFPCSRNSASDSVVDSFNFKSRSCAAAPASSPRNPLNNNNVSSGDIQLSADKENPIESDGQLSDKQLALNMSAANQTLTKHVQSFISQAPSTCCATTVQKPNSMMSNTALETPVSPVAIVLEADSADPIPLNIRPVYSPITDEDSDTSDSSDSSSHDNATTARTKLSNLQSPTLSTKSFNTSETTKLINESYLLLHSLDNFDNEKQQEQQEQQVFETATTNTLQPNNSIQPIIPPPNNNNTPIQIPNHAPQFTTPRTQIDMTGHYNSNPNYRQSNNNFNSYNQQTYNNKPYLEYDYDPYSFSEYNSNFPLSPTMPRLTPCWAHNNNNTNQFSQQFNQQQYHYNNNNSINESHRASSSSSSSLGNQYHQLHHHHHRNHHISSKPNANPVKECESNNIINKSKSSIKEKPTTPSTLQPNHSKPPNQPQANNNNNKIQPPAPLKRKFFLQSTSTSSSSSSEYNPPTSSDDRIKLRSRINYKNYPLRIALESHHHHHHHQRPHDNEFHYETEYDDSDTMIAIGKRRKVDSESSNNSNSSLNNKNSSSRKNSQSQQMCNEETITTATLNERKYQRLLLKCRPCRVKLDKNIMRIPQYINYLRRCNEIRLREQKIQERIKIRMRDEMKKNDFRIATTKEKDKEKDKDNKNNNNRKSNQNKQQIQHHHQNSRSRLGSTCWHRLPKFAPFKTLGLDRDIMRIDKKSIFHEVGNRGDGDDGGFRTFFMGQGKYFKDNDNNGNNNNNSNGVGISERQQQQGRRKRKPVKL